VSARDALMGALWDNYTVAEKNAFIDAHRDEVALEIGRDALRDGLMPTLIRLVGEANATKLMTGSRDAFAYELAEKIRTTTPPTAITPGGPYTNGVAWAADLIDPQKDKP
jgi:hypothetical protein